MKMNTVWLDKCFKAAEMLYGVFPFGVLERLYGGKLGRDETIKAAEGNSIISIPIWTSLRHWGMHLDILHRPSMRMARSTKSIRHRGIR